MNPIDEIHLLDYWNVLRRRRWVVLLAVVACGLVALLGALLTTPLYRATATLHIERQSPDILTFRDVSRTDYSWTAYEDFYETQYKILASETVAAEAARRLDLLAHPVMDPGEGDGGPGLVAKLRGLLPTKGVVREPTPEEAATALVQGGLEITPVRSSQLVQVSWTSTEPELAAQVANAVADTYIQYTLRATFSTTDQASEFLAAQVGQLKHEISLLEEKLQEYGETKRIVSVDESSNITLQALSDVSRRRTEAQAVLAEKKAAWNQVRDAPDESLREVRDSPVIQSLKGQYAEDEALLSEKSERFKDDWPELVALRSKLDQTGRRIAEETREIAERVRLGAESEYIEARDRVANLDRLVADRENDAQRLRRDAVEYNNLLADVDKKRETLDRLLARQNEMALSTRLSDLETTSSNVRVVTPARVPVAPFQPNVRLSLMLGILAGLALGVGGAFVLDHLDNSVVGPSEAVAATGGLPILAVVPRLGEAEPRLVPLRRRESSNEGPSIDLVTLNAPHSPVAEAYRDLRTSILLSGSGAPPRRLLVSSAMPSEGKSATAANLAAVMAQLGRRVVLVDADLRKPRLHAIFDLDNTRGATSFLSGIDSDLTALVREARPGLDVLTSGPVPPNPSELLNSARFSEMIERLEAAGYDHVVFDSPPTLSVADPVIVASRVDVLVLVVRSGSTPRPSLREAVARYANADIRPGGLVLNDVGRETLRYGGHGYGTYRGDATDETQSGPDERSDARVRGA